MQMNLPEHLLTGYRSFRKNALKEQSERYRKLAEEGQTPKTMMLACCDSRAAPETIFDAAPGEIFVMRNVANLVPPYSPDSGYRATSAALEFAVQALKVENIVVLGHGRCGGIKAALTPDFEPLSPGNFIGNWMSLLDPVAREIENYEALTEQERQIMLERASIRRSIENLQTFPCIDVLVKKGKLSLHGAWFDIHTGELWAMNKKSGDFSRVD